MKRRAIGVGIIVLAAFSGVAAHYGGWATITVENLPDQLTAAQPYNLTFAVRAHGDDLVEDLSPRVEARSGRERFTARAVQTNLPGYYTATITPPKPGDWTLDIQSGFGKSHVELLPIAVLGAHERRTVSFSAPEHGQRLFVAKGCLACHEHAQVNNSGTYKIGPVLTETRLPADYLARFLADPSIKPATGDMRMPDLKLKPAEINALIAFLNAQPQPVRAAR